MERNDWATGQQCKNQSINQSFNQSINQSINQSQETDVGAAPLYKTSERAAVVDFTVPYLQVHATLMARAASEPPSPSISLEAFLHQRPSVVGTLNRGVIVHAFRNTVDPFLRRLWQNIVSDASATMTHTNLEGIERVRSENFSFILPHTIGEYLASREPCDLITVGRFLMDRGYSLVIRKNLNSMDVHDLNKSLLRLQKRGTLQDLYERWWFGSSSCGGPRIPPRFRKSDAVVMAARSGAEVPLATASFTFCALYTLQLVT
jgi:hypothetical protein